MQLLALFREHVSGKPFVMRVMFVVWGFGALFVWAIVSLRAGSVQDLPASIVTLIAALGGFKAVQRFAELKWPKTS